MKRLTWAALALLVACKSGPANVVDLTIVADASVTASVLASVRTLDIAASGVQSKTMPYALPKGLPKQETVQLLPSVTSGTLTVTVTALDSHQVPVAMGAKSATLTGKELPLSVTLAMVAPPTLTITPPMQTITVGKTATLMTSRPATWSVMGGDANGTIDAGGVYTAPATAGTFTIVATDMMDPNVTATAMVTAVGYDVELLAGQLGGLGEYAGTGGAARLTSPAALAGDGNGTLYIADRFGGCVLHKLDLVTQKLTLIGGKPFLCGGTDGKLGSTALFDDTWSMVYDAAGNQLFLGGYTTIRRVNLATGDVTTLRDGMGQTLFFPGRLAGLAYDAATQTLYASNDGAHMIDKIVLSGAAPVVSVFAGVSGVPGSGDAPAGPATMANFNAPAGLAFDGANLYVVDGRNFTIRKIVVATGATTTIAGQVGVRGHAEGIGTGAQGALFDLPFGITLGTSNNILYVTEDAGSSVRSVVVSNGSTTTVAGSPPKTPAAGMPNVPVTPVDANGPGALFGNLAGIALDASSSMLYVADYRLGTVRQVATGGANPVQTWAGTPPAYGSSDGIGSSARFWSIGSLTSDGKLVYLADNGNAVIRTLDPTTGEVKTIAGKAGFYGGDDGDALAARFERPEGMFYDAGVLYISDGSGSTIRKLDLTTNQVTTLAGKNLATGTTDGIGSSARLGYPVYLTGDHNGRLYVADSIPGIRELDLATGELKTVAGDATSQGYVDDVGNKARFSAVYGLAVENGALYICDAQAGVFVGLRKMTLDTYTVSTASGGAVAGFVDGTGTAAQFLYMAAATGDGKGHIYLGDDGGVRRFDVATGLVTTIVGEPFLINDVLGPLDMALVGQVNGATVLPSGDLVVDDALQDVLLLARIPSP